MNTNMTGFRCFSNIFAPFSLDESSLSTGRVNRICATLLPECFIVGNQNKGHLYVLSDQILHILIPGFAISMPE